MYRNHNNMATAALVLSIVSLFTVFIGFSVVLGSLAIILALLSRGSSRMSGQAKAATGLGAFTFVGGLVILVVSLSVALSSPGFYDGLRQYSDYYNEIYGDEYENPYQYFLDLYGDADTSI